MSAIEQWGGHLPVGRRAAALGPIREAIAALSDQAIALHEAGDHEALAAGGQDLETVVDELSTLHRDVRLFVADLIDKRERVLRAADAERREAEGKKPIQRNDPDKALGMVRCEVPGVGAVEVNGGWDRKNWESDKLLRRMLHVALDGLSIFDAETGEDARDLAIDRVFEVLNDTMPVTPSMQWRVGTWPKTDPKTGETVKPATGLKLYGIDDENWCDRTAKPRLARWPNRTSEGAQP